MCEFDRAAENEQRQTAVALANQLARNKKLKNQTGTVDCIECGEEIPAIRRKALPHTTLCFDCQTIKELKR